MALVVFHGTAAFFFFLYKSIGTGALAVFEGNFESHQLGNGWQYAPTNSYRFYAAPLGVVPSLSFNVISGR